MKLTKEEVTLYKEEIFELTELLNTEWEDLKEILSEKIDLENAFLCSYFEDEEGGEYGIVLTKEKQIYQFSIQEDELAVEQINNIKDIEEEYPQVLVALEM